MLNRRGKPVVGTKILGVGVAYKANVADDRESASIQVLDELAARGAIVTVLDPLVDPARTRKRGFEVVETARPLQFELAVILTDHDAIDYAAVAAAVPVVFDARDAYRRRGLAAENVEVL